MTETKAKPKNTHGIIVGPFLPHQYDDVAMLAKAKGRVAQKLDGIVELQSDGPDAGKAIACEVDMDSGKILSVLGKQGGRFVSFGCNLPARSRWIHLHGDVVGRGAFRDVKF